MGHDDYDRRKVPGMSDSKQGNPLAPGAVPRDTVLVAGCGTDLQLKQLADCLTADLGAPVIVVPADAVPTWAEGAVLTETRPSAEELAAAFEQARKGARGKP
jgi:hypothetical protein